MTPIKSFNTTSLDTNVLNSLDKIFAGNFIAPFLPAKIIEPLQDLLIDENTNIENKCFVIILLNGIVRNHISFFRVAFPNKVKDILEQLVMKESQNTFESFIIILALNALYILG